MLELDNSIHVLYGSNDVAYWTIFAALLTFTSTLVVGVAAYKNGRAATHIAQEASDRDAEHRQREADQLAHQARSAVALAAINAVTAYFFLLGPDKSYRSQAQSLRMRAISEMVLYTNSTDEYALVEWFESNLKILLALSFKPGLTDDDYRTANSTVKGMNDSLAYWANNKLGVEDLKPMPPTP